MNTKEIGEKIRKFRAIRGYSQANIAEDLGITAGAYAKIERGEIDPNTSRLLEIAKILEVNITEFFDDKFSSAKESKIDYGYATKDQVSEIAKAVELLSKEIAKLREEMPKKKQPIKIKKKYNSKN